MDTSLTQKRARFCFTVLMLLSKAAVIFGLSGWMVIFWAVSYTVFGCLMFVRYRVNRDLWYISQGILFALLYLVYFASGILQ